MKRHIIQITIVLLTLYSVQAQPDTLWSHTFGGESADGGRSVIEAIDDGYIIAGYTYSYGNGYADFYLVKTDIDGKQEWAKTFGGTNMEYAYDVCRTIANDGYIIVGYTASFGNGSKDVYMVKTDLEGNEVWSHTYGGEGQEFAKSVIPTTDGHYLICGYQQASGSVEDDIYLIKTDQEGNLSWERIIGSEHSEMGEDVIETSDGNYLVAGSSGLYDIPGNNSGNNREMYLAKIDPAGNLLEERLFWIMLSNQGAYDDGYSVCESVSGHYYIVGGCTRESYEVMDIAVVRTDSQLNMLWKKHFEMDESSFYDFAKASVASGPDGGIVVCGSFRYAATLNNDLFVLLVDSSGNETYTQYYGGHGSEAAYAVEQTQDGNIIITGHTSSSGAGSYDTWLLKFDLQTGVNIQAEPKKSSNLKIFPNPAYSSMNITFTIETESDVRILISDLSGKVVRILENNTLDSGAYCYTWDGKDDSGNDLPAGIYFCNVNTENWYSSEKIIKAER